MRGIERLIVLKDFDLKIPVLKFVNDCMEDKMPESSNYNYAHLSCNEKCTLLTCIHYTYRS